MSRPGHSHGGNHDPQLGIIFLGPNNSGKTTTMNLFGAVPQEPGAAPKTSINVSELRREKMEVNGVPHTIIFRDVPGQDLIADNLPSQTLRNMHVCVIVADITQAVQNAVDPFGALNIAKWLDTVRRFDPTLSILVALNKVDLLTGVRVANDRIVDFPASVTAAMPAHLKAERVAELVKNQIGEQQGGDTGRQRVFCISAKTTDGTEELLYEAMRIALAKSQQNTAANTGPASVPAGPIVDKTRFGLRPPQPKQQTCPC